MPISITIICRSVCGRSADSRCSPFLRRGSIMHIVCCFGKSIGVHVDAGKSHHANCTLVFFKKMFSPRRALRNIHDIEHINKYKRFLTGIVKRPCRMLFKKWFAGGVHSTVCGWVHPQRFCLCDFCFNCTAGDFLAHHIMVIFLRSHKRIVAVRPVIELYEIVLLWMTFKKL